MANSPVSRCDVYVCVREREREREAETERQTYLHDLPHSSKQTIILDLEVADIR